jgi:hypothetical protein
MSQLDMRSSSSNELAFISKTKFTLILDALISNKLY